MDAVEAWNPVGTGGERSGSVARMPFARYLARVVGETPAQYVVEAMEWLWGEEAIRRVVRERKSHRVRNYYGLVRRAFRQCDQVIGKEILVDGGEMSVTAPYGRGHVYTSGIVKTADVVIVESKRGNRSIAFEVGLMRGSIKRNGRFAKRIRNTFVVVSLPLGDRGIGKERSNAGTAKRRGRGRDSDTWDVDARRTADGLLRAATGDGRGEGEWDTRGSQRGL